MSGMDEKATSEDGVLPVHILQMLMPSQDAFNA